MAAVEMSVRNKKVGHPKRPDQGHAHAAARKPRSYRAAPARNGHLIEEQPTPYRATPVHPLKTVDLFAGCGGLTLGLHLAGHQLLFAVEKDPMAFETFRTNFLDQSAAYPIRPCWPEWLPKAPCDIKTLLEDGEKLEQLASLEGKVDLVCGGPPCQGFSVGGIRNGNDVRNQLPRRYLDFVALIKPTFVLMENVEGMARKFVSKPGHDQAAFVNWIKQQLDIMGYDAEYEILSANNYGVPQFRRRVFLFAQLKQRAASTGLSALDFFRVLGNIRKDFLAGYKLPLDRPVTVREAIDDLSARHRVACPDSPKFDGGTYQAATSAFAQLLRRGIPETAIPNSHRFSKHTKPILDFYNLVHQRKMFGRLPKTFLVEQGTKKDKKVLIDPTTPASTITTHPDEFIHYKEPRNITVREMARIQSFPDDFVFKGRYTINGPRRRHDVARCSQVGNAVPPLVAEAIGIALHHFQHLALNDLAKNHFREMAAPLLPLVQSQLSIASKH